MSDVMPETSSSSYAEFFRRLTGHHPYGFQEDLIGNPLLRGKSVVFRAPTGCGKTWAAVTPFLYARHIGSALADRLLYALPLRSLASSLHKTVVDRLRMIESVETSTKDRTYPSDGTYCSLQMGGEGNDPFFEGDLTFCTIDQLLSGYLMMPLSLPSRLGNIVAGALPGSYVVLDEAHLLESGVALGTVIELLGRFKGAVQFVLMTATMSDESIRWLAAKLGAEAPELPADQIRQLPVQRNKRRLWRWKAGPLTENDVTQAHCGGRTLVIVNQVGRAQALFSKLSKNEELKTARIACLHSRFFPQDRQATEDLLQSWFGPGPSETNVILVTTQAVEAGIDISADHILTDLAPMNSLIQRAGRTARYEKRSEGAVTVFEVDSPRPYSDSDLEVTRTRECLSDLPPTGQVVDFELEQSWIERVHGAVEKADLAGYENIFARRQLVESAISEHDRGRLSDLVRDIDSVNVLLTDRPGAVSFENGKWPLLLNVPRTSIWKLGGPIEAGLRTIWRAESDGDETGPLRFRWEPVGAKAGLSGVWLVAVGSEAARYSKAAGLMLGEPGEPIPVRYAERPPIPRYQYFFETWVEHIRRVLEQAKAMGPANSFGALRLERVRGLRDGQVEELVRLAAALHDAGKLTNAWQDAAWDYESKQRSRQRGEPIAHTTKGLGDKGPALPHHAVEGAFAVAPLLAKLDLGSAAWALASAIARHHSPTARECQRFELIAGAEALVKQWVGAGPVELRNGTDRLELADFSEDIGGAIDEQVRDWWPLYAYLVRRLRLADQAGTAAGVRAGGSRP
jgi:CRISPR-associated endonuclease/helicase Cas3